MINMRKVFWDDPYQTVLNTQIDSVSEKGILLKETIIFSFSGGQESDNATINGVSVVDSKIEGNLIYYQVIDGKFIAGQEVSIEIDWIRRYRLMRLHFAAELILELVTKKLNVEKMGAHISEDKARIDFNYDSNISAIFESILNEYNKIITADEQITTGFDDAETQRRYWEIKGFSKVPCGGTHVKSTAEVGFVTLKRKNVGRGKERIEISLVNQN